MAQHDETPQQGDRRLEAMVGNLLRAGVLIAAAVVLVGAVGFLLRHGLALPHYGVFEGEPSDLRSVGGIVGGAFSGSARGVIQLGLLLLIATPVMRVVLLVIGFALRRDRLYVFVSLAVLASLLFGLLGGRF